MRTVTYTSLRNGILAGLGYTSATASAEMLADIAEFVTQAMDSAWHWCFDGWPELKRSASRTASGNVIALTRGTGIDPIGQVLNVYDRDPFTSINPGPVPFSVTSNGIQLNDDVGAAATVFVSYLVPAPQFTTTAWATATVYAVDDVVFTASECYLCLEAHTSGAFATDLAADKWEKQDVPAFLSTALKTAVVAAMREQGGQTNRMTTLQSFMERQLERVAERYDFSRTGGAQRMTGYGVQ